MTMPRPRLSHDLRLALSVLYSLPSAADSASPKPQAREAHDYLMQFQSRNVRRKLSSKADSQKYKEEEGRSDDILQSLEPCDFGSSWLACLGLLATHKMTNSREPQVHYAEALFAAQTMVHRLRRVNLSEAIDLEFEAPHSSLPPSTQQIIESYLNWSESFNLALFQALKNYQPHSDDEECVKGELTVISLTTILYCLTLTSYHELTSIRPLLATMASALAVTAARLRYTSEAIPSPAPNTQPIVKMIIHTLNMVHQVVSATASTSPEEEALVYGNVLFTCMSAIPDAILAGSGSGGGAYGRMSMDPRCYTAVTTEVRTQGIAQVWESFIDMPAPYGDQLILFLNMCESWAKYVPLPQEFVRRSVALIEQAFLELASDHPNQQQFSAGMAALRYWIAIMEGGSWTVQQVLASSLIQKNENSQQSNKKRQTAKSKKRQKEVLEERTTENQYVLAQNEVHHRAEVACEVTMRTWHSFQPLLRRELSAVTDVDDEVQGNGPVGGIIACANACLPYLVRQPTQTNESLQLFVSIGNAVHEICSSAARSVRGFAAESMYILQEVVMTAGAQKPSFGNDFETIIVDHFFKCCMSLATQCRYPPAYFNDLRENNDEELELERNDVRDVFRGVVGNTCSADKSHNSAGEKMTSRLLLQLLEACALPIIEASTGENRVFPESALHAFSALARPLYSAALIYIRSPANDSDRVLNLSLDIMSAAGRCMIRGFSMPSNTDLLPLSRLYSLTSASLSPMLSALSSTPSYENAVLNVLDICIQAAVLSLIHLPELTAPSTLRSSRFDIRGAMRSPGGEDHVGVLTLMRMATESLALTNMFLRAKASVVIDLCHLYEQLKAMENERGRGVLHGRGVLPKSRRILLGVICHLEIAAGGKSGASGVLQERFQSSVTSIANSNDRVNAHFTADSLFYICESVFDLAAFSPNMVNTLFEFKVDDPSSPRHACINVLCYAGVYGFQAVSDHRSFTPDSLVQWNRLRGALFMLIKSSGSPDLPTTVVDLVRTGIKMECEAIVLQCNAGPKSPSLIFHDELISEEVVPAGTFLQALGEILDKAASSGAPVTSMTNVIRVLFDSRAAVQQAIAADCPNPIEKGSFFDPRPTVAEAWFLTINKLLKTLIGTEERNTAISNALKQLLVESCVSIIGLLLYPSLGKTQSQRANDPGMSFDGPQTLAMMEFLHLFFSLGLSMLQVAAAELLRTIPVDPASIQRFSTDPNAAGISIIGAALFRAVQGGLPPWAVECIPSVYASLFHALNKDPTTFGLIFEMSIHIRLVASQQFGGVQASALLGGRLFETMGDRAKHKFVTEAMGFAKMDTPSGWRQLKALIKKACGGKKRDTDFNQKPTYTKWEALDRI